MEHFALDHRSKEAAVTVEARLFNSLQRHAAAGGTRQTVHLPAGSTVADLARQIGLPEGDIRLVLRNGRPVAWNGQDPAAATEPVAPGDVVAFSGPVPLDWHV